MGQEGQEIEKMLDTVMVVLALVRVTVYAEVEAYHCAMALVMACRAGQHQVDVADRGADRLLVAEEVGKERPAANLLATQEYLWG